MKALAMQTVFIILTVIMFMFFAVVIIFGFINIAALEANQATCSVKLSNYCLQWASKGFTDSDKPYEWSKKAPIDCSKFLKDVSDSSGPDKEQCKPIVK